MISHHNRPLQYHRFLLSSTSKGAALAPCLFCGAGLCCIQAEVQGRERGRFSSAQQPKNILFRNICHPPPRNPTLLRSCPCLRLTGIDTSVLMVVDAIFPGW